MPIKEMFYLFLLFIFFFYFRSFKFLKIPLFVFLYFVKVVLKHIYDTFLNGLRTKIYVYKCVLLTSGY